MIRSNEEMLSEEDWIVDILFDWFEGESDPEEEVNKVLEGGFRSRKLKTLLRHIRDTYLTVAGESVVDDLEYSRGKSLRARGLTGYLRRTWGEDAAR